MKQPPQRVWSCTVRSLAIPLPDLDGSVRQELPVAGPAAVGGAVVAGCSGGAYGAEACLLWTLAQVFQRDSLMVPRLEVKLPHAVDLHKRVVKLGREAEMDEKQMKEEEEERRTDGRMMEQMCPQMAWRLRPPRSRIT